MFNPSVSPFNCTHVKDSEGGSTFHGLSIREFFELIRDIGTQPIFAQWQNSFDSRNRPNPQIRQVNDDAELAIDGANPGLGENLDIAMMELSIVRNFRNGWISFRIESVDGNDEVISWNQQCGTVDANSGNGGSTFEGIYRQWDTPSVNDGEVFSDQDFTSDMKSATETLARFDTCTHTGLAMFSELSVMIDK